MKKIKNGLSILVLLLCSINALGQFEARIIYEVSRSTIDCENNKVCYTIAVKADRDLNNEKPFYYNSATFRYFIDADIFEKPKKEDYIPLLIDEKTTLPKYTIEQNEIKEPTIGNELGFRTERTYWPKADINASFPKRIPRVRVTREPVEIMKICLTLKEPLNTVTSEENLCYPFVFDYNPVYVESGMTKGSEGISSGFTDEDSGEQGATYTATRRDVNQYLWSYDSDWNGDSNNDQAIGHTATEGCMQNTCLCYASPTKEGTALETFAGISTLDRNVDGSWVDNSKSGFLKLESKTLGFVPTRMTTTERDALTAEEGMVVWNITNKCLEYYNGTEWVCSQPKCKNDNQ